MRLTLAALAALLLLPGCLEPAPPGVADDGAGPTPAVATRTESMTLGVMQPVGVTGAPAAGGGGSADFTAPAGTLALSVRASWSCISLCPMHMELVGPDGAVLAEDDGGTVELVADPAEPGAWQLRWQPRGQANVGVIGEAEVMFTVAA